MITPRPIYRSLSYVLITACILLGFLFSARAFFPTNVRTLGGALGKSHEKITNEAITELDQEFFGNNKPTSTMEAAIKEIVRANEKVDDDQKTAAKHFDGEKSARGPNFLLDLRKSVIMALQKNDADGARTALGRAFILFRISIRTLTGSSSARGCPISGLV